MVDGIQNGDIRQKPNAMADWLRSHQQPFCQLLHQSDMGLPGLRGKDTGDLLNRNYKLSMARSRCNRRPTDAAVFGVCHLLWHLSRILKLSLSLPLPTNPQVQYLMLRYSRARVSLLCSIGGNHKDQALRDVVFKIQPLEPLCRLPVAPQPLCVPGGRMGSMSSPGSTAM